MFRHHPILERFKNDPRLARKHAYAIMITVCVELFVGAWRMLT